MIHLVHPLAAHCNQWSMGTTFFSKKKSPTQATYSGIRLELLSICTAIKNFRYRVEARNFTIFTDHKPISFPPNKKNTRFRQFRQLDFVGQFITDIRYISGKENVVADALSRVKELFQIINYNELAKSRGNNKELNLFLLKDTSIQLKKNQNARHRRRNILRYFD